VSNPIWGSWPDIYYCLTITVLFLWGALSVNRTCLSLLYATGPFPGQSFSSPSPLGLATIFYFLKFETSLFVASYDLQGHGGGIRTRLQTSYSNSVKVKVKVTLRLTASQSVSLGVEPPSGAHDQIFFTLWHLRSCFVGRPSDKRTGLSFVYGADPCQRGLSRVRVPWNSRPYFTVSDSRLPFSSPPTTRRVTVEGFDPASTRVSNYLILSSLDPRYGASGRIPQKTSSPNDYSIIIEACFPLRYIEMAGFMLLRACSFAHKPVYRVIS
jgi:hypothetical protein